MTDQTNELRMEITHKLVTLVSRRLDKPNEPGITDQYNQTVDEILNLITAQTTAARNKNGSICGCIMCEFHVKAFELNCQPTNGKDE